MRIAGSMQNENPGSISDGIQQRGVIALDAGHGVVHELADGGLFGLGLEVYPTRFGRHPKNIKRAVFVRVFRVGAGFFSASSLACCSSKASEMYLKE